MNKFLFLFVILSTFVFSSSNVQPNFVIIYVDDMGYADIGKFQDEKINTPNLDLMASNALAQSSQSRFNWQGSMEKLASGPQFFLSNLKCFSIADAPFATAIIEARFEVVWSDNPTSTLKCSAI